MASPNAPRVTQAMEDYLKAIYKASRGGGGAASTSAVADALGVSAASVSGMPRRLAARGLVAGILLGFTRALGEFGATVILAGNIPGRTQTLASAIFTAQQVGNQARADLLMAVALAVGFAAILGAELLADRPGGPLQRPRTGDEG